LYQSESRFRLSESTQKISFYDLVDFDKALHPKPYKQTDPIFYHWTSHNSRASSAQMIGHVFPNKLTKLDSSSHHIEDDFIGLQVWVTRCNKPRTDLLLLYNASKKIIQLLQNAVSYLKNHFCDFSYMLSKEDYNDMMKLVSPKFCILYININVCTIYVFISYKLKYISKKLINVLHVYIYIYILYIYI